MSIGAVRKALAGPDHDQALVERLVSVWPVVEEALTAFAEATSLPIFAYIGPDLLYHSPVTGMPPFCQTMLGSPALSSQCFADGARRSLGAEPDVVAGLHLCHAGLLNGRRVIDTGGLGELVILFGSRGGDSPEALRRRAVALASAEEVDVSAATSLQSASVQASESLPEKSADLMTAIARVIHDVLASNVGLHQTTRNMAHELLLIQLNMYFLAEDLSDAAESLGADRTSAVGRVRRLASDLSAESELGSYVVRNFLSHFSAKLYSETVVPELRLWPLAEIVEDTIRLQTLAARRKGVRVVSEGVERLPMIRCDKFEMKRALYNVLNNAIKYSYHSVDVAERRVEIGVRVPYDPSPHRPMGAIVVRNYGLGLAPEEIGRAMQPGFRGTQAQAEVPIGSGLGLSEVQKVMRRIGGDVRIQSRALHRTREGEETYLTTVMLLFPIAMGF